MLEGFLLAMPTSVLQSNEQTSGLSRVSLCSALQRGLGSHKETNADANGCYHQLTFSMTSLSNNHNICHEVSLWDPLAASLRCGEQKPQCEPPTVFTSSALSVPHGLHRARPSVPSLHESSYSLGRGGKGGGPERPCWSDLIPPGLTMAELCCYINIYSSLVSLLFFSPPATFNHFPLGQSATGRARLFTAVFVSVTCRWFCAGAMTRSDPASSVREACSAVLISVCPFLCVHSWDADKILPSIIYSLRAAHPVPIFWCEWQAVVYRQVCFRGSVLGLKVQQIYYSKAKFFTCMWDQPGTTHVSY